MNGIHDMGGMQDMGPVQYERNEPVFHHCWEGRMLAINQSLRAFSKWKLDAQRHQINLIPPAAYLNLSYYEKWLRASEELLVKLGMVTPTELATGRPDAAAPKALPALDAATAARRLGRGIASSVDPKIPPHFRVGESVRVRNINPEGHTQLPRYARGKAGMVAIDHGVYDFPDTNAHGLGEKRQHVYAVRFAARELWGGKASARDTIYIDMWDDYLERA